MGCCGYDLPEADVQILLTKLEDEIREGATDCPSTCAVYDAKAVAKSLQPDGYGSAIPPTLMLSGKSCSCGAYADSARAADDYFTQVELLMLRQTILDLIEKGKL